MNLRPGEKYAASMRPYGRSYGPLRPPSTVAGLTVKGRPVTARAAAQAAESLAVQAAALSAVTAAANRRVNDEYDRALRCPCCQRQRFQCPAEQRRLAAEYVARKGSRRSI